MKQLSEKEVLETLLSQHKLAASSITNLILESSSQQLRNDASTILQSVFSHQKQIFDQMAQKGWYQTEAASAQEITKVKNQLTSQAQFQS